MTANAFMSVSIDPPLAMISVRRKARFAAAVSLGDSFGVNFLAESQEALSNHFGGRPAPGLQPAFALHHGTPLLEGSLAQLVLRTVAVHEAGDHFLYVGAVEHLALGTERRPLVFFSGAYKQVNIHKAPQVFWASDGW
jgi:flavin reductase (DIM6/NTAB) family NADH-FMN oxidoreductase RutF